MAVWWRLTGRCVSAQHWAASMKTEPQRQKCQRAKNTNATRSGTAGNESGGWGRVHALVCLLDSRGSDGDVPYVGVK